jgi:hypothetical protein
MDHERDDERQHGGNAMPVEGMALHDVPDQGKDRDEGE